MTDRLTPYSGIHKISLMKHQTSFFKKHDIMLGNKKATGMEVPLPEAPLVLIWGQKGYIMCGYLDVSVAEKLGARAAVVSGVKTTGDMLKKPVVKVTAKARELGIVPGMSGEEALRKLL